MLMGLRRLPIGSARTETPQWEGLFGPRERCGGESIRFFPGSRVLFHEFRLHVFSCRWLVVVLTCFLGESVCFGLGLGFLRILKIPWRVRGLVSGWESAVRNVESGFFWPILGWIACFWGELWDGLDGS